MQTTQRSRVKRVSGGIKRVSGGVKRVSGGVKHVSDACMHAHIRDITSAAAEENCFHIIITSAQR